MVAQYKLKMPHEVAGLIKSLHPGLKSRIKAALESILQDPHSGKALRDELKGLRSFRIRRLRIIYKISSDKILEILAIGPRKNIYKETFRLISKKEKK
jgi:mRNA interferase RelE/StbE